MINTNTRNLAELVTEYQATRSNTAFEEIYAGLEQHRAINRRVIVMSGLGTADDALALFDDVILRCLATYRYAAPFDHYLAKSLKFGRSNFFRSNNRRLAHYGCSADEYDGADYTTPEATYIEEERKKETVDAVDYLLRVAVKTYGPKMTAIISDIPRYPNLHALGKAHGIHRNIIFRKTRRLSRYYDASNVM